MAYDLRHLRHVTILADAGTFSRAAEMAGITQPALSRSVAALEAELGFAIFDRLSSGIVPTVAGAQFVQDARKLLLQARQLEADARALAAGEGGTLSFGLGPLLSSLILPELLALLSARFPGLRVMPMTGSAVELVTALSDRRIEMCLFAEGPHIPPGMTTRPVGSIPIGLLVRTGHPLAGKRDLRLADAAGFPLASGSVDGRVMGPGGPEPTIICENFHILRETVLQSDAVWLSSKALCSVQGQEELVELAVTDFPTNRFAILLARMGQRTPSPAGRAVEAAIRVILARIS
jgi:DNA-binding transcriptional LysR family regulator